MSDEFSWYEPAPSSWLQDSTPSISDYGFSFQNDAPTPSWSSFMTLPGFGGNFDSGGYDYSVASPEFTRQDVFLPSLDVPQQSTSFWDRMNQPIFSESGSTAQNAGKITPMGALLGLGGTMLDNALKERMMKKAQKNNQKSAQQALAEQLALRRQAMDATGKGFYDVKIAPRTQNATQYGGSGQYNFFTPGQTAWSRTSITPRAAAKGGLMQACSCGGAPKRYAGGGPVPHPDAPSVMGFLRYLANGKKLPSEIAAEQAARKVQVINSGAVTPEAIGYRIQDRNEQLDEIMRQMDKRASGGAMKGQADTIPALLSDGEYVVDADVVAALGDGSTEAGAAELDKMREAVRSHKRAAPTNKIPPKAKSPLSYMKKGK